MIPFRALVAALDAQGGQGEALGGLDARDRDQMQVMVMDGPHRKGTKEPDSLDALGR